MSASGPSGPLVFVGIVEGDRVKILINSSAINTSVLMSHYIYNSQRTKYT